MPDRHCASASPVYVALSPTASIDPRITHAIARSAGIDLLARHFLISPTVESHLAAAVQNPAMRRIPAWMHNGMLAAAWRGVVRRDVT